MNTVTTLETPQELRELFYIQDKLNGCFATGGFMLACIAVRRYGQQFGCEETALVDHRASLFALHCTAIYRLRLRAKQLDPCVRRLMTTRQSGSVGEREVDEYIAFHEARTFSDEDCVWLYQAAITAFQVATADTREAAAELLRCEILDTITTEGVSHVGAEKLRN